MLAELYNVPPNRQSNLQYMKTELCTQQTKGVKPKQTHFVTSAQT